jgi:integrase
MEWGGTCLSRLPHAFARAAKGDSCACGLGKDDRLPTRPLRPHDLRHTAVALWIAAGANPKEVATRAGHTSVAFALDRYGHLFPEADERLRDRLGEMFATVERIPSGTVVSFVT